MRLVAWPMTCGPWGVEQWDIGRLRPHPRNYRRHPEHQLAILRESLRVHGQQKPVVITPDGTILAGHGVVEAAKAEGWTQVACHIYDGPYPEAFLAIDNRSSDLAEDDESALAQLLKDIDAEGQLLAAGWNDDDLAELLARTQLQPDGEVEEVEAPEPPEVAVTRTGDLWQMGEHRFLCGDSTNEVDVARLMNGERAILFATDPPYLVDYDGTNHPSGRKGPDKNKDWSATYGITWDDSSQGPDLYRAFIGVAKRLAIVQNAAWYCWHASRRQAMVEAVWEEAGAFVHQQIVWVKDRGVLTRSHYLWQHEPCFFGWLRGHQPPRVSEDYPTTVWQIPTVRPGEKTDHPTSKPIQVFAIPMLQHVAVGGLCYEPFAGSGSQFIAGEQLKRRVFGLEIAPQYVDVCVLRWQRLTGKSAVLAGDGRTFSEIAHERGVELEEPVDENDRK